MLFRPKSALILRSLFIYIQLTAFPFKQKDNQLVLAKEVVPMSVLAILLPAVSPAAPMHICLTLLLGELDTVIHALEILFYLVS